MITAKKRLGIWMDHSNAHIIEFSADQMETQTLNSKFTNEEKGESLGKSEQLMHNKEQHLQAEFYKELGEVIKKYDEVLLFGPTSAKLELHNILKEDHHFDKIKIETASSDKMTENQQYAFVKEHFTK